MRAVILGEGIADQIASTRAGLKGICRMRRATIGGWVSQQPDACGDVGESGQNPTVMPTWPTG
jgi:hypothetical protein